MGLGLRRPESNMADLTKLYLLLWAWVFEFPVSDVSLSISAYGKRYFIEVTTLHSPCQYREQNLFPAKTETNPD
jgi:hypothetical protein